MNNSSANSLLKILWFLFSDVNTRINILIEESAHLQNTVYGLLSAEYPLIKDFNAEPTSSSTGISDDMLQKLRDAGFERPVVIEFESIKGHLE